MSGLFFRALGFTPPTLVLVITLHLVKTNTTGEFIDGLVSGLWFSGLFLLGSWARGRLSPPVETRRPISSAHQILLGFGAALITWGLVWLAWQLPLTQPLRQHAFISFGFNNAMLFLAGLGLPGVKRRAWRSA